MTATTAQTSTSVTMSMDAAEQAVHSAANLLHEAARTLTSILDDAVVQDLDDAKHRFALANSLADKLTAAQSLVGTLRGESENIIIGAYSHGTNVDIEGVMFHRYDETRQNSVSYKTLYEKAYGFLTGSQKGVLTKMEADQKSTSKTYKRLKPGVFKGKK